MQGKLLLDIIRKHELWIQDREGGERADLRNAYLSSAFIAGVNLSEALLGGADLSKATMKMTNLSGADLTNTNLSEADLSYANLSHAYITGADLSRAHLFRANLSNSRMHNANLSCSDISHANLSSADVASADLSGVNLSYADLSKAKLTGSKLSRANLSGALMEGTILYYADLHGANLSGANGLVDPSKWLAENFERDDLGYIVYKAIGRTDFTPPNHWKIEPGSFIEEVVDQLPTDECGCGVNFATRYWISKVYPNSNVWRCRIHWIDLPGVVVPYRTDGKARCSRLELIEIEKE